MADFLNMGGYAEFVWSAFGITAVTIIANIWSARRRFRSVHDELELRFRREEQLRTRT